MSARVRRRRLVVSRSPNCATSATTSTRRRHARPPARARLGTLGTRYFGTRRPTSRRASGSASSATKRITAGIAVEAVPHRPPHCRKLSAMLWVTPMTRPPTNVHGRLRRRPMIAAAKASTMNSVSTSTRNPTLGARRIPAIAAIDDPSAHANDDTRPGRTPCSAASSRSSTTARMATPVRLRWSNRRRKTATRIATTMVTKRCHVEHDVADVDAVLVGEELRQRRRERVLVPDGGGQPHQEEHESDRHHELHDEGRRHQPAHQRPVDERAEQRGHDQHHEHDRDPRRPSLVDPDLPVEEGHDHPDGALREVEDTRRRVRDHESRRGDGVDRTGGERVDHRAGDGRTGERVLVERGDDDAAREHRDHEAEHQAPAPDAPSRRHRTPRAVASDRVACVSRWFASSVPTLPPCG